MGPLGFRVSGGTSAAPAGSNGVFWISPSGARWWRRRVFRSLTWTMASDGHRWFPMDPIGLWRRLKRPRGSGGGGGGLGPLGPAGSSGPPPPSGSGGFPWGCMGTSGLLGIPTSPPRAPSGVQ
eukprot:9500586-Pyramimonas_sp.AAC.1